MSNSKLQRETVKLQRKIQPVSLTKTPIILSDSKAKYLKYARSLPVEFNIVWWYQSGATARDRYLFLKDNIEQAVNRYQNIVLYVWLGTCDLTKFIDNKCIDLRSADSNSSVNDIIREFRNIYTLISTYATVELVFLEIPVYSIVGWNKSRGHKNPEQFQASNYNLESQINIVNRFIRETNLILHKHSPKFSLDLQNCRKGSTSVSRFSYKFNAFYLDGVHPSQKLSKLWLLRIVSLIIVDCL